MFSHIPILGGIDTLSTLCDAFKCRRQGENKYGKGCGFQCGLVLLFLIIKEPTVSVVSRCRIKRKSE